MQRAPILGRTPATPVAASLAGAALAALLLLLGLTAAVVATAATQSSPGQETCVLVGASASEVPARAAPLYKDAAQAYRLGPRGFAILAAIHRIESGSSMGGHVTSSAGAVGPMQFIPLTWSQYGADGDGDGKRDIASAPDAIFAAANYLHASGAPADWHKAIFAYNHAEWYVRDVLRLAVRYGGELHCTIEGGLFSTAEATGPAEFGRAITLRAPRSFTPLPPWAVPPGYPRQSCDTRIVPNLLFLLQRYDLRVTACRATGHRTHGAGTAADIVPSDAGKQSSWSRVAKMASDMGWRPACARHGCIGSVAPALRAIFYNGYPGHGDPRHTRSAHGHVWWDAPPYSAAGLQPPRPAVKVFPVPGLGPGA